VSIKGHSNVSLLFFPPNKATSKKITVIICVSLLGIPKQNATSLAGVSNRNLFSHGLEPNVQDQGVAHWVSSEASLLGLQMDALL
jgi:hypothetical protein